jgi:malate dehydrogenase
VDILSVEAVTLGSHGETMVPVPSQVRVGGRPLREVATPEQIESLAQRTRDGGAEIVALLKQGSAYYAPSAAAAAMVRAVVTDTQETLPVCAWVDGEYGIRGVYLGITARLGKGGIEEIVELPLEPEELKELRTAAEAVKAKVAEMADLPA